MANRSPADASATLTNAPSAILPVGHGVAFVDAIIVSSVVPNNEPKKPPRCVTLVPRFQTINALGT
jgi:hypothetical protein